MSHPIDPVLAEYYPGRGLNVRTHAACAAYEVVDANGRVVATVDDETVERIASGGDEQGLEAMFDAIDKAGAMT